MIAELIGMSIFLLLVAMPIAGLLRIPDPEPTVSSKPGVKPPPLSDTPANAVLKVTPHQESPLPG